MRNRKNPQATSTQISRRSFAALVGTVATVPGCLAQTQSIRLNKLSCFEICVTDLDRSLEFYRDALGMPEQARIGDRVSLRIGSGPQFMAVRPVLAGEAPAITQLGYSVQNYETGRVVAGLESLGFERTEAPSLPVAGLDLAMKTWISHRGETEEVYFADERGLVVQLTDPSYCGGTGPLGNGCNAVDAPPGLLALNDLNHFTVFVNGGDEANRFYQDAFGLSVQAYQGPQAPVTGIGDGFQFVMYAGPASDGVVPANIHHVCFNMEAFDVDRILSTLTDYGLKARGDAPTGPLMHYVSLRMPERGGAEGGTPELYFTDPDGILLQLQHTSYCGGGGYLGNECL